ncbi:hypothetical protein Hanom_Chr00s002950g01707261 [Helianthus anomalus]
MKMAYETILEGLTLIPLKHYGVALLLFWVIFMYKFLEFHFLDTLFRGSPVSLTYNSASEIYHGVASKCRLLHGRYMPTPWLSSPHIQTAFLNFHGRPPLVDYTRKLFHASDGGTFALDWLKSSDGNSSLHAAHMSSWCQTHNLCFLFPSVCQYTMRDLLGEILSWNHKDACLLDFFYLRHC